MTPGVTPGDHELRRSRDESSDGDVEEGGSSTRGEPNPSPTPDPYPTPNQAFCELPNLDLIVPALLEHGLASLHEHAKLNAGIPVKPMLAKPTKGLSEVLDRMGQARRHAYS